MQAPIIELTSAPMGPQRLPAHRAYWVSYAQTAVAQGTGYTLIEQRYNARDAFLCLLEVHAREPLEVPIRCRRADLCWLYAIQGPSSFTDATGQPLFSLVTDRYALAYVPKGSYRYRVPAGKHLLFFFMVKGEWLLRHTHEQLGAISPLLGAIQNQSRYGRYMPSLPIHPRIRNHLLRLLYLPQKSGISADAAVYSLLVDLIVISLQDMQDRRGGLSSSLAFVDAVRAFIAEQVRYGPIPPLAEIATGFRVSMQYMARIHKEHYGYTLEKYRLIVRLREAFRLLQEARRSPSEVAYHLGYGDLSSFSRQFKQYYGIAPRDVR